jgi:hypothetical protein
LKKYLYILFLLVFFSSHAQEKTYSFNFEKANLLEIISAIDQQTPYDFKYAATWFDEKTSSFKVTNRTIEELLDELFQETIFNYYRLEDQIIITRYRKIYDELPEGFFKSTKNDSIKNSSMITPSFQEKFEPTKNEVIKNFVIGKQGGSSQKYWISLTGSILNGENNSGIEGAVVATKGENATYAITDQNGFFELRVPRGEYLLDITAAGFQSLEQPVTVFSDGSFSLQLFEAFQNLEGVVLLGSRINPVNSSETGVENIDVEESKTIPLVLGERDVLKVAATLPGISSAGEGATGLNVRGGKPDQNLNLLDGGVIYNPTHFFGIFQALNPVAIGQVNIYKGSVPAPYGGRLSSVFDLRTKDADLEQTSGELSLGPVTFNGVIKTPLSKGKSSMITGVRGAYSDWLLKRLKDENLQNTKANFYDVINKIHVENEKGSKLDVTTYYSKDKFNATRDSLFSYSNLMLSVNYRKNLGNKVFKTTASVSDYRHQINYSGNAQNGFIQNYGINHINLLTSLSKISERHQIEYGNTTSVYNIQPGSLDPRTVEDQIEPLKLENEQAIEGALFASDVWKVNDQLEVNGAIRLPYYLSLGPKDINNYETGLPLLGSSVTGSERVESGQVESSYFGAELRLSARYLVSDYASIKLGVNNAYQYLHTLSNNTAASPFDSWRLSNRYVRPQEAQQVSFGYAYREESDAYDLTFDLYYKKYENLTDLKTGANTQLVPNIETQLIQGDGKAYGAEFMIRKNRGDLNGWISYTYSRSLIRLNSDYPSERVNQGSFFASNFDKPHDLNVVANYKLTRRFSLSGNFTYQTGRPITIPTGKYDLNGVTYVTYSRRNEFRIPDYMRFDIGFNVEGNHKLNKLAHSFWSISVYNILGRNNPYSMFFVNEDNRIKAYQVSIFARAIPSISYNLKF